jgi:ACS family hexuronate transporter-like MFS transporter
MVDRRSPVRLDRHQLHRPADAGSARAAAEDRIQLDQTDWALIIISFRIAYALMQTVAGRVLDWLGSRRGLLLTVSWYSIAAAITSTATGLKSFIGFRFLSGTGEAANWPGATKTVSEWFPKSERGWAVALFDSGSSVGGAVAPFLVFGIFHYFGSWRPAFLVTAVLGTAWVLVWRAFYHPPETHPNLGAEERAMILNSRKEELETEARALTGDQRRPASWGQLLARRETWGIIFGRALTDPVWFFITDWFAIYLVAKGFKLENTLLGFWVPFLAADLGNFFGGGLSSWLIKRGWTVGRARRTVVGVFGPSMLVLIWAAFATNYWVLVGLFAYSTFAYAACATIFLTLPADAFHSRAVASVSGLSGTGAGIGTLISTYLIGRVADAFSFQPIIIAASIIPCLATVAIVGLVRAGKQPDPDGVVLQF